MTKLKEILASTAALTGLLVAPSAFAQFEVGAEAEASADGASADASAEAEPVAEEEAAPAEAPPPPVASAAMAEPAAAAAPSGETDHDQMVGRLAVGWLGRTTMPIASGAGGFGRQAVTAPVVGVRMWMDQQMGLDLGAGLILQSGSNDIDPSGGVNPDDPPTTMGLILHGGVPLSLAQSEHFSFQIVPEANLGFAQQSSTNGATNIDTTLSGIHFDVGARAGAEIHFGFMGIPELSLQGGVGANLAIDRTSATVEAPGVADTSTTATTLGLRTTVNGNPWDIFSGSVGALYYF